MNRRLRVGDKVCIRPDAALALHREGYQHVPVHVPAMVIDEWTSSIARRVLALDIDGKHRSGQKHIDVYPSQARLYDGYEERLHRRSEKMQAEVEAMKAARRAEKKGRRTK